MNDRLSGTRGVAACVLLAGTLACSASAQTNTTPRLANGTPLTIGETFTIASGVLGEDRRINVYVPTVHGSTGGDSLPVLYMPDGGVAEDFVHVAGLLQVSVGNGTMRPFMLVGIENTDRRRDMTGPTSSAEDRKVAPRAGGSGAFRRFIRNELMPAVRSRYPTTRETAIVGESMAGLFIVETFLVEPDLFDTYIAFDPSLWWDDERLVKTSGSQPWRRASRPASVYLASSAEPELATLTRQLADVIEGAAVPGIRSQYHPMPEETHATIYHPAALRAFRTLFAPAPTR